ncbi:hypothetical protein JCM6882_008016 [Rhodosporidiobolus microsporus]
MVSQELAIAAIAVAAACLIVLVVWTVLFFRFYRRQSRRTPINRNSVSYPTAGPTTTQLPQLGFVHRPSNSSPFPLSSPSSPVDFLPSRRAPPVPPFDIPYSPPLVSPLEPPPHLPTEPERSPSSPLFSISTTVSRSGSRVLARNPSSNNSHGTSRTSKSGGSSGRTDERRRSKPEKAKRVKKQFGVGEEAESEQDEEERVHDDTVIVEIVGGGESALRRRNSTWGASDLEHVASSAGRFSRPPPASPPAAGTVSAPSSVRRPAVRPLPPGAGYGDETPSPVEGEEGGLGGLTGGGAALSAERFVRGDDDDEPTEVLDRSATWSEGRKVVVQNLRDLRARPLRDSFLAQPPVDDRRWSSSSSLYANSNDEYSISAASISQHQFFSTFVAPLPPPSPSSDYHSPAEHLVSAWSASSRDSPERRHSRGSSLPSQHLLSTAPSTPTPLTDFPPSTVGRTPPLLRNAQRASQASVLTSSTAAALEDLESYAASLSSSHGFAPPQTLLPPPSSSSAPALSRRPSRRQDSASWFASPSDAPPSAADLAGPVEELDTSQERERELVFQQARRPISWLARQKSDGSLPEGVATIGQFSVANPDSQSLKTSGGSSGRFSPP